jgi:hypothetical protein
MTVYFGPPDRPTARPPDRLPSRGVPDYPWLTIQVLPATQFVIIFTSYT